MADPANFDKLQTDYALRYARAEKHAAARMCLCTLTDQQPEDVYLDYVGVLHRLQAAITTELQHEEGE